MEEKHLDKTGLSFFWSKLKDLLAGKQDALTGSAGQLVGFGVDGKPVAQDAPSSGREMVLLWENASPKSTFAAQTISLDCSKYSFFTLVTSRYQGDTSSEDTFKCNFNAIKVLSEKRLLLLSMWSGKTLSRDFYVRDNSIQFSDAGVTNTYGQSATVNNGVLIPLELYGMEADIK